ncbi:hypothetical protein RUM43_012099 [Polyplax serrata]|uniref:Uncharacterized protein n=1 Tax=Polyplax serrata TaxID=468196 RepID=A0AAN8P6A8_POLSC
MFLKFGIIFLSLGLVSCDQMSTLTIVTKWVRDMTECGFESYPTDCLEARTIRQLHGMNSELQRDLNLTKSELNRSAKNLKDDTDEELQSLEVENQDARIALEKKIVESRGLVDEIGDFIVYLTGKILSPFIGGRGDDTSEEEIDYHQKQAVEVSLLLLLCSFLGWGGERERERESISEESEE